LLEGKSHLAEKPLRAVLKKEVKDPAAADRGGKRDSYPNELKFSCMENRLSGKSEIAID